LAKAATQLATLQEKLAGTSGPVSDDLRSFVQSTLGDKQFPAERVVARYAELLSEVRRIESLVQDIQTVIKISGEFELAGAQKLAARVTHLPLGPSGEDTVLPISWRDAWNWARIKFHLDKIEAREELLTLASRRSDLEAGLAKLYENMVSKSAWLMTKTGASPRVLSALETYKTAIRRIGQGTGTNATRHRRDAQKAMLDAQGAYSSDRGQRFHSDGGHHSALMADSFSHALWPLPSMS
jgi:hypothetical protein